MENKVLSIAKWRKVFETSDSRRHKSLEWVSMPVSLGSNGYQTMLDDFEDDAPAIYGAWCALVAVAASCNVRGVLSNNRGEPMKISHIARKAGFPVEIMTKLIEWAQKPDVAWLVPYDGPDEEETTEPKPNKNNGKTKEPVSKQQPNDNPSFEDPQPVVLPDQTKQDQDLTKPNTTTTRPNPRAESGRSSVVVGDYQFPWDRFRQDVAVDLANAMVRDRQAKLDRALGTELIWQIACVGSLLDEGFTEDLTLNLRSRAASKRKYAEATMRRAMEERGYSWRIERLSVPPKPSTSEVVAGSCEP